MRRSFVRMLIFTLFISGIVLFSQSAFAQGKGNGKGGGGGGGGDTGEEPSLLTFDFGLEYASVENAALPEHLEGIGIRNVNRVADGSDRDGVYVVGVYTSFVRPGTRGFIYIRYDDGSSEFIDMPDRVGLQDAEFTTASCNDINPFGIVVGGIRDINNLVHPIYFSLFESESPQLHYLRDDFPGQLPAPSEDIITARCVNAVGDIFLDYHVKLVANPFTQQYFLVPVDTPQVTAYDINDVGTVLGRARGDAEEPLFRYNIHDTDLAGNSDPLAVEYFSQFRLLGDPKINNLDEFCARQDVPDSKRRNRVNQFAVRHSSQVDWSSSPVEALSADSINDSGDICGEAGYSLDGGYFHYAIYETSGGGLEEDVGPTVDLQSLVTDNFFATGSLYRMRLTSRIELSSTASAPVVCGTIRNRDYPNEYRLFFLIPQLP